jgi:NhaP-type Na+/H+ or K+/H+ antiporter
MKRNFNGLIGMGIGLLYLAVVASAVLLAYLAGLTPVASMYVGCAASAVGAFASRKIALRQGRSAYLPR